MNLNTLNLNNDNKIEKLLPNRLDTNWPFSIYFAKDLFYYNKYGKHSSLKDFLMYTWLEKPDYLSEDSKKSLSENQSLINEEIAFWPNLKYKEFFIENNIVFFKEVINQENTQNLTKEKDSSKSKFYDLSDIEYQTLICQGSLFYMDYMFKNKKIDNMLESAIQYSRICIWGVILCYLLFTPYSFSIKSLLEKKNYMETYEKEIFYGFYSEFKNLSSSQNNNNILLSLFNKETKECETLKERFKTIFDFSNIPTNEANKLIEGFFATKNLDQIISYYSEQIDHFEK